MENKHKKFAPFDRVLVRIDTTSRWECDFYSYYEEDKERPHRTFCYHLKDENIIPYEGNEHLVGTTDEHEKEIKLEEGEFGFFTMNSIIASGTSFSFGKFAGVENEFMITSVGFQYSFFVRFSDFDPYDMEETRKHILCVKNGRIVRFKE